VVGEHGHDRDGREVRGVLAAGVADGGEGEVLGVGEGLFDALDDLHERLLVVDGRELHRRRERLALDGVLRVLVDRVVPARDEIEMEGGGRDERWEGTGWRGEQEEGEEVRRGEQVGRGGGARRREEERGGGWAYRLFESRGVLRRKVTWERSDLAVAVAAWRFSPSAAESACVESSSRSSAARLAPGGFS
jgi:hypothetical protein